MISVHYLLEDPGIRIDGTKGAAVHVRQWLQALAAEGARVEGFVPVSRGHRGASIETPGNSLKLHTLEVQRGPGGWGTAFGHRAARAIALSGRLYETVKRTNGSKTPDLIYTRYSLYGTAAAMLAEEQDIPLYLEVNAPLRAEEAAYRTMELEALAESIEQRVFRSAARLIAVSKTLAAWLEERGVPREKILVVNNGVDTELFHPGHERDAVRARLALEPGAFVVGFAGSLKPWHGVGDLLTAFAGLRERAPEARLLVVGDGPQREELESQARAAGIEADCTWVGGVPHEELPPLLAAGDVWCAPYPRLNRFYFSPLKIFEYASAGRPIVASSVGQIAELLEHERNALLVSPGDAEELGQALFRLRNDPELRASLSESARREVALRNSWRSKAAEVLRLAAADLPRKPAPAARL